MSISSGKWIRCKKLVVMSRVGPQLELYWGNAFMIGKTTPSRYGTNSAHISRRELAQLFEVRKVIEANAVKWATERAGDAELYNLLALVEEDFLSITYQIIECKIALWEHDTRFHAAIFRLAGNAALLKALQEIAGLMAKSRQKTLFIPGRARKSLHQHIQIARLMARRKAPEAAKAMQSHIDSVSRSII